MSGEFPANGTQRKVGMAGCGPSPIRTGLPTNSLLAGNFAGCWLWQPSFRRRKACKCSTEGAPSPDRPENEQGILAAEQASIGVRTGNQRCKVANRELCRVGGRPNSSTATD